jgi:hypothetical protein
MLFLFIWKVFIHLAHFLGIQSSKQKEVGYYFQIYCCNYICYNYRVYKKTRPLEIKLLLLSTKILNWVECNLDWNQTRDYKIARPRSESAICIHKFDFSLKLHDTKFNFHLYYIHFEILNIFVHWKRFCLQKTHLRYQPRTQKERPWERGCSGTYLHECWSIATISKQDEVLLNYILHVQKLKYCKIVKGMKTFIKNKRQHV